MTGPHPSVAATRLAVRRGLLGCVGVRRPVLVACSGGADSLALLAATVFEGRGTGDREGWHVVGVTVDHGLQEGSQDRAASVVAQMADLGVAETMTIRVAVDAPGIGPEAAARQARYAALAQAAQAVQVPHRAGEPHGHGEGPAGGRTGEPVVLLGHTRDDQAETVLLGLTHGSGGRSLAGMRRSYVEDGVRFVRPLLDLTRAQTEAACAAQDISVWSDPHNDDPRFTRSRLRQRVMPVLEDELGPGVAAALARTADLLQEDMDELDELADRVYAEVRQPVNQPVNQPGGLPDGQPDGQLTGLSAGRLEPWTGAVANRVLRRAAVAAGCPPSELFRVHVLALADLVLGVPGRRGRPLGQVQLPGHVTAYRQGDLLRFRRT